MDVCIVCPNCKKEYSVEEFRKNKFCNCGRFLSFKDKKIKITDKKGEAEAPTDVKVKRLLELREEIDPKELVPALNQEASILIRDDPFAFVLAASLDRGTKAEIIWTIPYFIKKKLGHLDPAYFAGAPMDELQKLIRSLPSRPRYITDAPRTIQELSRIVLNEFSGDASKLWESRSAKKVIGTMRRVYGVGPGIAAMTALLIERWFNIKFSDFDRTGIDVKADVHIIRVFGRLGFISVASSEAALNAARRLNPAYPGALDPATWMIGRNYCHASRPACIKCPMEDCCPKIV